MKREKHQEKSYLFIMFMKLDMLNWTQLGSGMFDRRIILRSKPVLSSYKVFKMVASMKVCVLLAMIHLLSQNGELSVLSYRAHLLIYLCGLI